MEGLFGQESVPDYEIRSDTLDALQRLMKRHERSCLINSELRADAERKKQEYEGEGTTSSLSIAQSTSPNQHRSESGETRLPPPPQTCQ